MEFIMGVIFEWEKKGKWLEVLTDYDQSWMTVYSSYKRRNHWPELTGVGSRLLSQMFRPCLAVTLTRKLLENYHPKLVDACTTLRHRKLVKRSHMSSDFRIDNSKNRLSRRFNQETDMSENHSDPKFGRFCIEYLDYLDISNILLNPLISDKFPLNLLILEL
jgi:hypothetical protein